MIQKQEMPSANILVDGNEKKIYQNNLVFLNDQDNFQLKLHNPLGNNIGVEIKINGQSTSYSKLILKPGQNILLDRYIDDNKKMVFNTYDVEDNETNKNAIKNNGKIEINFYYEQLINTNYYSSWSTNYPYNGFILNNFTPDWNITYGTTDGTYCSTLCNKIETGRIEKGNKSKQQFNNTNMIFEFIPFHTIEYNLLPQSQKPVTIKDLRLYCPMCKRRIKSKNWKFCPNCSYDLSKV